MSGETTLAWPEARAKAYHAGQPLEPVEVALGAALGTVLAADLPALADLPPFDTAAMDGFAVRGSGPWRVSRRVLAGRDPGGPLVDGEAAEVATGSRLPVGTESVLPYEDASLVGAAVRGEIATGRHVRQAGEDYRRGTCLITTGDRVTPVVLGLAASAGYDRLRVRPRPRIAAVVTGDELQGSGLPTGNRVRDAVGPILPGLVTALGGELVELRRVGDDSDALRTELLRLAGKGAEVEGAAEPVQVDAVVTCGASAAGPTDHLRALLAEMGAKMVVESVACKPGHPQTMALLPDGPPVVGLPGNPFAALVALLTLLDPLVARLTGRALPTLRRCQYEGYVQFDPARTRLIPVTLDGDAAKLAGRARPGLLWGAAMADGLAVIPPAWNGSTSVPVVPLPQPHWG